MPGSVPVHSLSAIGRVSVSASSRNPGLFPREERVKMSRVKFKMKNFCLLTVFVVCLLVMNCGQFVAGRSVKLYFERCSPYDTKFELDYITIGSCSQAPCVLTIGKKVKISGSFTYTGDNLDKDIKLFHRPNWLLNYVYTAATVQLAENDFPTADRIEFAVTVYVDESLAPLQGTLNWRLYDENENRVVCYNIPIQLALV